MSVDFGGFQNFWIRHFDMSETLQPLRYVFFNIIFHIQSFINISMKVGCPHMNYEICSAQLD